MSRQMSIISIITFISSHLAFLEINLCGLTRSIFKYLVFVFTIQYEVSNNNTLKTQIAVTNDFDRVHDHVSSSYKYKRFLV